MVAIVGIEPTTSGLWILPRS